MIASWVIQEVVGVNNRDTDLAVFQISPWLPARAGLTLLLLAEEVKGTTQLIQN